jgi:hypothetical protein
MDAGRNMPYRSGRQLRAALAVVAASAAAATAAVLLGVLPSTAAVTPAVSVPMTTTSLDSLANAHTQIAVADHCPSGSLVVGGGSYLRNASNPATIPTNGVVLFGDMPSDSAGAPLADGATNPTYWATVGGFSGARENGDQQKTFAMCETSGGPASTVVVVRSTTGANATQEVNPPIVTTATCTSGRLLGGGAYESTPGQLNDGTTSPVNSGNLKPVGSYPSSSSGVMAANGATNPDSWSGYGSAGIKAATDTITVFAICSTDPAVQPTVTVVRDDKASTSSVTSDTVSCSSGQLIGGGFAADETVGGVPGIQPQQGHHMRGSYPSDSSGAEVADGATNPSYWTDVLQQGGAGANSLFLHTFGMCEAVPATPSLSTIASTGAPLGGSISDSATLSGGSSPGGTIEFDLYGPDPTTCTGTPVATRTAGVDSGNGIYGSGPVTPTAVGTYHWLATYSGDTGNAAAGPGSCSDPSEAVTITLAQPGLSTNASGGVTVGGSVSDSAAVAGGSSPTGTVTFKLYGPADPGCGMSPVFTSSPVPLSGGTASSGSFTTNLAGTYHWIASYSGDANNATATGSCTDSNESVAVAQATPSLSTAASAGVALGGTVSDTATVSGGFSRRTRSGSTSTARPIRPATGPLCSRPAQ